MLANLVRFDHTHIISPPSGGIRKSSNVQLVNERAKKNIFISFSGFVLAEGTHQLDVAFQDRLTRPLPFSEEKNAIGLQTVWSIVERCIK
jgi:hypothetical protein